MSSMASMRIQRMDSQHHSLGNNSTLVMQTCLDLSLYGKELWPLLHSHPRGGSFVVQSFKKEKKETSMKLKAITKTMVSERRKGYWSANSHPHMQNVLEDIGIGNRLTMANMEKCAYLTRLQFAKSRQISLRCSSP